MRLKRDRREYSRFTVLPGGRTLSPKEGPMTQEAAVSRVEAQGSEQPGPTPGIVPSKHKLPPEYQADVELLAKEGEVRWGGCKGTTEEPHEDAFYVGFLNPGLCPVCCALIPTEKL
jgi:hypothetical protein